MTIKIRLLLGLVVLMIIHPSFSADNFLNRGTIYNNPQSDGANQTNQRMLWGKDHYATTYQLKFKNFYYGAQVRSGLSKKSSTSSISKFGFTDSPYVSSNSLQFGKFLNNKTAIYLSVGLNQKYRYAHKLENQLYHYKGAGAKKSLSSGLGIAWHLKNALFINSEISSMVHQKKRLSRKHLPRGTIFLNLNYRFNTE